MSNDMETVHASTVTLYPVQWAIIAAYAKDKGYPSTSAALRRIIDEWQALKQAEDAATQAAER